MKRLEKQIEEYALRWVKNQAILTLKLNLIGNTGWPDRVMMYEGRTVFIEFKRPGSDLERNQPERIDDLVWRKFTVGVFDDFINFRKFVEATLLSKAWRQVNDPAGVCVLKLQCREGYFCAGQTVREKSLQL